MRNALLALLTLPAVASLAFAQYYPAAGNPYYGQIAAQPIQRMQYPYGAYNYAPPFRYPVPPNAYGYNNGYGVNYYYVQNPYANYSPAQQGPAAPAPVTPAWPEPVQNAPPLPPADDDGGDPEVDPAPMPRGAGISFHRPTCECFWLSAGYTAMLMRPMHMNGPLATTGSVGDPVPGALGQPNTRALFGDKSIDFGLFSGIRAELGVFLDRENRFSLDVAGFYMFANNQGFFAGSDQNGNTLLSRPYFNVADGFFNQYRLANSQAGLLTGTIAADFKSQISGLEFNSRLHSYIQDRYHGDLLAGFRYVRLSESMVVREQISPLPGTTIPFAGTAFNNPDFVTNQDNFRTVNQFVGPQFGARISWEERWFTLNGFVKVGVGATLERTDINGSTSLVSGNGAVTANGGVLALPSNSGGFNRAVFGVLPEFGFDLGVNVTQNVRVKFGYSLLYWNHVVRPGSQYDTALNPGQINSSFFYNNTTGPASPAHRFNEEVFWINSFNLGMEIHY
ncbi:MAG TPA: BBP7 family outer membrane beta-barrel protein [Gemmataceae bacterium]|nr:BBP7 family outer membrane beta-barrel protein [Gemmataceae bacterium]